MANPVKTLGEIPAISRLYRQGLLRQASSTKQPVQLLNDSVGFYQYDITKLKVDGIVNAANRSLLGGGGVDGAIHRGAGPQLLQACSQLGGCLTGEAKITPGYDLPAERVIHTVGPMYRLELSRDPTRPEKLLRSCYRCSLELAVRKGLKSIAFSCISTGVYGYPNDAAALIAADEVRNFLEEPENAGKLDRVIFCLFRPEDVVAYEKALPYVPPPNLLLTRLPLIILPIVKYTPQQKKT